MLEFHSYLSDKAESESISPELFVKFVIDENKNAQDLNKVNEHWRPQSFVCPFCLFPYNVYGRFETSAEDTAYILLKSNLVDLRSVGKINSDIHVQSKIQRRIAFWSQVPSHYINDLKNVFSTDFSLLQYS